MQHLVEAWGDPPDRRLFFIYYNPVHSRILDADPAFARYAAEWHRFTPEEAASTPFANDFDSVVIWQKTSRSMADPKPGADREVIVDFADFGAIVQH